MKKLAYAIVSVLLVVGLALAAGETIVVTKDKVYSNPGSPNQKSYRVIEMTLTAGPADASMHSLVLNRATTGIKSGSLAGWMPWFMYIKANDTTPPTDASDLTALSNFGADMLAGGGTDKVDATSVTSVEFMAGGTAMPLGLATYGDDTDPKITFTVANNAVASAIVYFQLFMYAY